MNTTPGIKGMSGTLRIRPSARAMRDAVAWHLPGSDPRAWLEAMGRMGVPMASLRVLVLPISAQDRRPCGILVTTSDHHTLTRPHALCEAYGIEAGVLYLPTHARLLPALSAEECRRFILAPFAVFHPVVGLVAFEQRDLLTVFDLMECPRPQDVQWDQARPGVALNTRLLAVLPDSTPTLEQLDQDLRGDIGTQPLKDLPAPADEPKDSVLGRAAKAVARGFLRAIRAVGNAMSGRSNPPSRHDAAPLPAQNPSRTGGAGLGESVAGFFGRISDWAGAAINRLSPTLRQRELDRLERMLKEDPAEALKYAIPLSGLGEGRGIAPPSNLLSSRDPSFSLSDLGGGRPVDVWDMSWQQQQSLMRRYRELAAAESRMGRHRRAAYIYATLLGDLDAAAKALVEGGFHREAATIYRDRLKRPEAAANCLAQGGLLLEAARLYIELEQWLEAARLYRRLGRDEDARSHVMREVEKRRDRNDHSGAADLLEKELADIDAAIDMLRLGFHGEAQRYSCFQRLLDTFGRLGRHRETKALVSESSSSLRDMNDACHIAQHMGRTVTSYPDRATADSMGEAVLALVSDRLRAATNTEADRLAATVALLAPHDRLLLRDSQSYTKGLQPPVAPKPLPPTNQLIREVMSFQVTGQADHMACASVGRLLYVAACDSTDMTLIRCDVTGRTESMHWTDVMQYGSDGGPHPVSLHVGQHENDDVLIAPVGPEWEPQEFALRDSCPRVLCRSIPWLPPFPRTFAICTTAPGAVWTLRLLDESLLLDAYSHQGAQIHSVNLDMTEVAPDLSMPPKLYARPRLTVLGWGKRLHLHPHEGSPRTIDLQRPILDVVGTAPFARSRFVATHDAGATIVWARDTHQSYDHLAADMHNPVAAFTHNSGLLVLASSGECRVWSTSRDQLTLLKIIKWPVPGRRQPAAVLPIEPGDDFVVIFRSGEAVHHHVEPPSGARH